MFRELHVQNILHLKPDALMMDSTTIKVHPDACSVVLLCKTALRGPAFLRVHGALKKVVFSLLDAPKVD